MAILPILALAGLLMGQGAIAGYAAWTASGAARIGARAEALGSDPRKAVRAELPSFLRADARVTAADSGGEAAGRITVRLQIPSIVPGISFGTVHGRAQLPNQVGA